MSKILRMKKNKWFKRIPKSKYFESIKASENLEQAWEKTILKWELIVQGFQIYRGQQTITCGLCDLYYKKECWDCPISEKIGLPSCLDTPIRKWNSRRSLENAKNERDFLIHIKKETLSKTKEK